MKTSSHLVLLSGQLSFLVNIGCRFLLQTNKEQKVKHIGDPCGFIQQGWAKLFVQRQHWAVRGFKELNRISGKKTQIKRLGLLLLKQNLLFEFFTRCIAFLSNSCFDRLRPSYRAWFKMDVSKSNHPMKHSNRFVTDQNTVFGESQSPSLKPQISVLNSVSRYAMSL